MDLKSLLNYILKPLAPGPSPSYDIIHVIETLELIRDKGPIGRGKLSRALNIGEGVMKTLLRKLRIAGIIEVGIRGVKLTAEGLELAMKLKKAMPIRAKFGEMVLTVDKYNYGILVKGKANLVKKGLEQRDAAIKAGASGASTLIYVNGRLIMPPDIDISLLAPNLSDEILSELNPEEGDVIVIGSGADPKSAKRGALAAALTLIDLT